MGYPATGKSAAAEWVCLPEVSNALAEISDQVIRENPASRGTETSAEISQLKANFDRPFAHVDLYPDGSRRAGECCNAQSSPSGPALVQPLAQRST